MMVYLDPGRALKGLAPAEGTALPMYAPLNRHEGESSA